MLNVIRSGKYTTANIHIFRPADKKSYQQIIIHPPPEGTKKALRRKGRAVSRATLRAPAIA